LVWRLPTVHDEEQVSLGVAMECRTRMALCAQFYFLSL
jgi:hypothetical protein